MKRDLNEHAQEPQGRQPRAGDLEVYAAGGRVAVQGVLREETSTSPHGCRGAVECLRGRYNQDSCAQSSTWATSCCPTQAWTQCAAAGPSGHGEAPYLGMISMFLSRGMSMVPAARPPPRPVVVMPPPPPPAVALPPTMERPTSPGCSCALLQRCLRRVACEDPPRG